MGEVTTAMIPSNYASPNAKDEMEFRLSLLKLMTVPHEGASSMSPATASRQIEELAILVPRSRRAESRP